MDHKLDNIDKKILEILQKNARTPIKEIAKEVFLSSPAVSSRIDRLEQAGVLLGYHAAVNPLFLGYHIKAFINLEVEPKQKKSFIHTYRAFRMSLNATVLPVIIPC